MPTEAPILAVSGLTKRFGGVTALEGVGFELRRGEVLALAGDNGAGKSTLIKAISGVHQPDEGEIVYKGERVDAAATRATPARSASRRSTRTWRWPTISTSAPTSSSAASPRHPLLGFLPRIDRARMRAAAREVLATLEIDIAEQKLGLPVRNLSGGQRQAVAIGRAIFWKAELLIMDEPTAALGVPEQRKVIELIRRLRQQNVAVIFISHNLVDIFAVADRILVLRRGLAAGERRPEASSHDEIVRLMVGRGEARDPDQPAPPATSASRPSTRTWPWPIISTSAPTSSSAANRRHPCFGFLPRIDRARMRNAAREVLATLEIDLEEKKLGLPVRNLSGGQRQAVAIGRAIFWKAELLIMDEPTAALGVPEQRKVVELIRGLRRQNVAVIFISHNLVDIFAVADRILVLRRGIAPASAGRADQPRRDRAADGGRVAKRGAPCTGHRRHCPSATSGRAWSRSRTSPPARIPG